MKTIEKKFWQLIEMLDKTSIENGLIKECLSLKLTELSFSYFSSDNKTSKKHIFNIYKIRSIILPHDKGKEPFVIGYELLLPALERSELEFVNVSSLTTEEGTFIIFSDYDYLKYIGILKSKKTLSDVREIMINSPYYKEITFLNGILTDEPI